MSEQNQNQLSPEQQAQLEAAIAQAQTYDETADFYAAPPPPAAGQYVVTVALGQKGVGPWRLSTNGQPFFMTELVLTFDSGQKGFAMVSNLMRGGRTSELHTLFQKIGQPIPQGLNGTQVQEFVKQVLENGARVGVEWDWEASVDTGSADKKNKYKTILAGMHNFPADPNADSGHNHIVQYNGKDVAARGVVKKWVG